MTSRFSLIEVIATCVSLALLVVPFWLEICGICFTFAGGVEMHSISLPTSKTCLSLFFFLFLPEELVTACFDLFSGVDEEAGSEVILVALFWLVICGICFTFAARVEMPSISLPTSKTCLSLAFFLFLSEESGIACFNLFSGVEEAGSEVILLALSINLNPWARLDSGVRKGVVFNLGLGVGLMARVIVSFGSFAEQSGTTLAFVDKLDMFVGKRTFCRVLEDSEKPALAEEPSEPPSKFSDRNLITIEPRFLFASYEHNDRTVLDDCFTRVMHIFLSV